MSEFFRDWWQAMSHWAAGSGTTWVDLLISGVIVAVAIAIAIVFSTLVFRRLLRLSIMSSVDFDVKTAAAIRLPFAAFIVLSGIYVALTALSPPAAVQVVVNKTSGVIAVLIGASLVNGVASASLLWVQIHLHRAHPDRGDGWMLPLVRRGVLGFVIAVAGMVCLDILGINISRYSKSDPICADLP